MREIKFRAWDDENRQMLQVDEIRLNNQGGNSHIFVKGRGWLSAGKGILMQCAGLKDKNGTEIYDGDIVKFEYGIGRIYWDDLTAQFKVEFDTDSDSLWLYCCKNTQLEVIGNIYENPELLHD